MPFEPMHPRIAALARELFALTENPPAEPTAWDREKLMAVRYKIRDFRDEHGAKLCETDETDRQYLYVEATAEANRQDDFYERHGNKWATRPYEKMTDEEAQAAINTCIRRKLRNGSGVAIADIYAALKVEVGVIGVALDIYPEPVDGRLPEIEKGQFQFQFMAVGPSGATIR